MPRAFRKFLSLRSAFRKPQNSPGEIAEEIWDADFSKPQSPPFDIKSETSYDANLQKTPSGSCLSLGIKKTGCIAWAEAPGRRYHDQLIQAKLRLNAWGGYAAAGIMFRVIDEETYYSFLISNKGYFRLDVFRNGTPMPLIAWTELSVKAASEIAMGNGAEFSIIAYGSHFVILIQNEWAGEINDSTILEGGISFIAASYENTGEMPGLRSVGEGSAPAQLLSFPAENSASYTAAAFLDSLRVDSHISEVSALFEKWSDNANINPQSRFRLAETFTAMNQHRAALNQLRRGWDAGCKQEQKQLLLAGRLAQALGLNAEAEHYISSCFQQDVDSPEGKEAISEMAKILYASERYEELKDYCKEAVKLRPDDPIIKTFQGHAFWSLEEYDDAASSYDDAFELDTKNGILAKNAANVYEVMGKKQEALDRYIAGGRAFLDAENYDDLGLLVPKLLALGENDCDAHGLAGKWAFGIEDWETAETEFEKAEALRDGGPKDAAISYLQALILIRKGRRGEALAFLEEAADLEEDYVLFRFKLAENRYLLKNDPGDAALRDDLDKALELAPQDGWINNFAAQVYMAAGDLEAASARLEKASAALGEVSAIKVNRAELLRSQGKLGEALEFLSAEKANDPDGMMANCMGNFLIAAERFEEADEEYRSAIRADPDNTGYLLNRASCLIELGLYGEADSLLGTVYETAPSPDVLELISYVASKKGEFLRAETACREALEMEEDHVPSLFSLGWIFASRGRQKEGEEILARLDQLDLNEAELTRLTELRSHFESLFFSKIVCFSCGRNWKVPKNTPPVQGTRLFAMPPDHLPAGTCPECGKTRCIGCAKEHLDASDRFTCPDCHRPLKLVNEGLKKLIYDWTVEFGPQEP